jgi:hypothetical protein
MPVEGCYLGHKVTDRKLRAEACRLMRSRAGLGFALALSTVSIACAEDAAQISVNYAPDFAKDDGTVSVFGVFRDGRLSPESWREFGPALSVPLGRDLCESAYTSYLISTKPALASAIDEYTKENGVTDQLLEQFAAAAGGKTILALVVVGHPPAKSRDSAEGSAASTVQPQRMGGGMRGMGGGRRRSGTPPPDPEKSALRGEFQMFASFFSPRVHHSVATLSMTYSGSSLDDALGKFADRLGTVASGSRCAGWNWQVPVDDDRIRNMKDE